ncbi:hypothetical protein PLICRDRAFT_89532 [Plicaturopsis crispa FD-325 SS-3]|nr:hypothetical protein PLICRDRAFT_89532 [Plicaturopsis crispa FD-325 SS-3]
MPSALILLADGTEEMEFTITYDTLVRAGVACTSAFISDKGITFSGVDPPPAVGSRGIKIVPDAVLHLIDTSPFDLLVIPGGAKGAETMARSTVVQKLVIDYIAAGKLVGMICAGSMAALTSRLPKQPITSHPSVKAELEKAFEYSEESVVVSGNLITSRGPGTAFPFAFTLVEKLLGPEKREEIRGPMVFPAGTPF